MSVKISTDVMILVEMWFGRWSSVDKSHTIWKILRIGNTCRLELMFTCAGSQYKGPNNAMIRLMLGELLNTHIKADF